MRPFHYQRSADADAAIKAAAGTQAASFLAGGTTLLDLMKLGVIEPARLIDINDLEHSSAGQITLNDKELRLGAMARMGTAADNPDMRTHFPVIAQALQQAASAQIRNMASLGGNVLQRTRCTYYRDVAYSNCNKRAPGSGCAAREGLNRSHAVLGTSDQCIATYPGDFAQALIALDARVELLGRKGAREIPFAKLHRLPGLTPHLETTLAPEDIILAFCIPRTELAKRSLYLKIRDRTSYEFALASAAVALVLEGNIVRDARIALGGVATVPWRAQEAEQRLIGKRISNGLFEGAAELAFTEAQPRNHNEFKIDLGKRTLIRALHEVANQPA
jgi:xanthine dehydrogenase YagS FAD-binding subunit